MQLVDRRVAQFESDVKTLRRLLIFQTVLFIAFVVFLFTGSELKLKLLQDYNLHVWFLIIYYIIILVFLWYLWTKFPFPNVVKINHTLSSLLLGVFGLWLWLPNPRQVQQMSEQLRVLSGYTSKPQS